MINERTFDGARHHALSALHAAKRLPDGHRRAWVIDNIEAAIGWIEQARDEWATREAEK